MLHLLILGTLLLPVQGVAWERDHAAAFEKAEARNVPVFLAFNMDGERASDSTALTLYRDPAFVKRSADFVCLIASTSRHDAKVEGTGDAAREVCSRFGSLSCDEHLQVEIRASEEFIGRDTVISPQHLLVSPQRGVLARKAYQASKNDLFRMMDMAEKAVRNTDPDDAERLRLKQLMKQATERNADVRGEAIAELGRMAAIEARQALFDLTGKASMDATRMDAIDALASKGNYDALPILLGLLKDKNQMVVKHALVALERLELPAAVEPLTKMWKKKPKGMVAKEIPRALASCAPDDEAVRELVYKAAAKHRDSLVELSAIVAMATLELDDEGYSILEKKLKDSSGNVRGTAVWSIGQQRQKQGIPILEKALEKENNAEVRVCMEAALRNIRSETGPEDPELANSLWKFLDDDIER